MYDARFVPVGEDQVAHLELSREAVRRFNQFYGEVLVEPQPLLTPAPRLPGLDNRKMSKSYGNTIDLSDDAEAVTKKVPADVHRSQARSAPTSPARSKAIRSSCTMTRSTPTPPRSRISRRATAPARSATSRSRRSWRKR